MDITVDVREVPGKDGVRVVDLNGEIDVYTSPRVKETITDLIDQGHYDLIINLENVRYNASRATQLSFSFRVPPD